MSTTWRQRASRVFNAPNRRELELAYDRWAENYDDDHANFGWPLLVHFVALFCRHVPLDASPILDAGAGTGRVAQYLVPHGYRGLVGIDLSGQMLEVARRKAVYDELHRMTLGQALDFADHHFAAVASCGAMSPGHAGADAFDELIRVTRPDGLLVLSMRSGAEAVTGFARRCRELEDEGRWRLVDEIPHFVSHPELDPPLTYGIHVFRVS